MSKELVITNLQHKEKIYTACCLFEEKKAVEMRIHQADHNSLLGNIYVGKIEKYVKNIGASFVRIGPELPECYLEMKQVPNQGANIIVQVSKDAVKLKAPCVTTKLNFPGKYLVLTTENTKLGVSSKIDKDTKEVLKKWIQPQMDDSFGVVVRTNAAYAEKADILNEFEYLKARCKRILDIGLHRTAYTLLEEAQPFYIEAIRDTYSDDLVQIRTDIPEYYDKIHKYLTNYQKDDLCKLSLHTDKMITLKALFNMTSVMEECLRERVWLPSGGFLIIQQTEAFTCIDVNTGKYVGKKKEQETYRMINLEAAAEIARQLRLRNLSGIILIDFINLMSEDHKDELMHVLAKHCRKDPLKTRVVDMTALGIVEVTRQRARKPVFEEL